MPKYIPEQNEKLSLKAKITEKNIDAIKKYLYL